METAASSCLFLSASQAALWVVAFYVTSFASNVLSKELVAHHQVSSSFLALLQLTTAVVLDGEARADPVWLQQRPAAGMERASHDRGGSSCRLTLPCTCAQAWC